MTELLIKVEQGCINQKEIVYGHHHRSNNWVATVMRDVTKPGGLDRLFWKNLNTSFRQLPFEPKDITGSCIEVGYDYRSASGKKYFQREYYEIVYCDKEQMTLSKISKP